MGSSTTLLCACLLTAVAGWAPGFTHEGALFAHASESSPVTLRLDGDAPRLFVMQSMMGRFYPDGQAHSYFCVFDALSGAPVSCPNASSGLAFFSAISRTDPVTNLDTMWVFGTAWDRAQAGAPNCKPWGCGACAQGHCYVGAFSSTDLITWTGPAPALTLPPNVTVPNVGVGLVNTTTYAPGLPPHQAFMALEGRVPGSAGNLVAVNTGMDGDLSRNWQLLNYTTHGIGGPGVGQATSCPSARYNPSDGYYYVMGGGADVSLTRSANLSLNSWQAPSTPYIETGCVFGAEDCTVGTAIARVAPGYYTQYWANGTDRGSREFLANLTEWNWSVNDVDFCDTGGVGPTYFIYGQCCQTAPANASHVCASFYQLGTYNGSVTDWLAHYYE